MTRFPKETWRIVSCISLAAAAAQAHADGEWLRHFRIGGSVGLNMSTDFTTSGSFPVSGANPGLAVRGIDHFYDDGFVRLDATGNAPVPGPGGVTLHPTSYWGYSNSSQRDEAANTITFRGTKSFTTTAFTGADDTPNLGFDLAYGGSIKKWDHVAIGAEFGFNFNMFLTRDRTALSGSLVRSVHRYSYVQPNPPELFPSAPYTGNPTAGQTIDDTPTALPDEVVPGFVSGTRSLEGILYNFKVGPLIRWEFYPRWTLNGSAGGALGYFDAVYRFNETITVSSGVSTPNKGNFGSGEVTYGGYAGAVLMYDSGNRWEAYLGAHFVSMQDVEVAQGGRSARLNLGAAVYLSAGINWSF